jgi:hypothetical protein
MLVTTGMEEWLSIEDQIEFFRSSPVKSHSVIPMEIEDIVSTEGPAPPGPSGEIFPRTSGTAQIFRFRPPL